MLQTKLKGTFIYQKKKKTKGYYKVGGFYLNYTNTKVMFDIICVILLLSL